MVFYFHRKYQPPLTVKRGYEMSKFSISAIVIMLTVSAAVFCIPSTIDPVSALTPPADDSYWIEFDIDGITPKYAEISWYTNDVATDDFQICSAAEFAGLAFLVNHGTENFHGKTITFMQDDERWNFSDHWWNPIGSGSTFSGSLDGDGAVIGGIFIKNTAQGGLFDIVGESASVKNLTIMDSSIPKIQPGAEGTIAGTNGGSIVNCHVTETVELYSSTFIGGIAGINLGTIDACSNRAAITGTVVGGIAATNEGIITGCSNYGALTGATAGGIAATNEFTFPGPGIIDFPCDAPNPTNALILNSDNSGDIIADIYGGGIAGSNNEGGVSKCYSTGDIFSEKDGAILGGIVGLSNGYISTCYNTGLVMSEGSTGALGGIAGSVLSNGYSISDCYNTGRIVYYETVVTGGIVGTCGPSVLSVGTCYNIGVLVGTDAGVTGQIFGNGDSVTVTNCYWLKGNDITGGFTYTQMTGLNAKSNMTGFDTAWVEKTNLSIDDLTRTVRFPQLSAFADVPGAIGEDSLRSVEATVDKDVPETHIDAGYVYTYGDTLSKHSVTGTGAGDFNWAMPGMILGKLGDQVVTVIFTPSDPINYTSVEFTTVGITIGTPSPEKPTYESNVGKALGSITISESSPVGNIPGSFSWSDEDEIFVSTGTVKRTIQFTPDGEFYDNFLMEVSITVNKGIPNAEITKTYDIVYGQMLSDVPITGGEYSVPGAFVWNNPDMVIGWLTAGQTADVTFIPTDEDNYESITLPNIGINVLVPVSTAVYQSRVGNMLFDVTITEPQPNNITGVFSWDDDEIFTHTGAVEGDILFIPHEDLYDNFTIHVIVSIEKGIPKVKVTKTYDFVYGQTLSDITITDEEHSVPGTFVWNDPHMILGQFTAGQTADVTFIPTDEDNYESVTVSNVGISVSVPVSTTVYQSRVGNMLFDVTITEPQPDNITGVFSWDDDNETFVNTGTIERMILFVPHEDVFDEFTFQVSISVGKGIPIIDVTETYKFVYGQMLSDVPIVGEEHDVPGTFVWSNPDTVLGLLAAGQTADVTFIPTDEDNYESVTVSNVGISVSVPVSTTVYQSRVGNMLYSVTIAEPQPENIPGTFTWTGDDVRLSERGTSERSITFTPDDDSYDSFEMTTSMYVASSGSSSDGGSFFITLGVGILIALIIVAYYFISLRKH